MMYSVWHVVGMLQSVISYRSASITSSYLVKGKAQGAWWLHVNEHAFPRSFSSSTPRTSHGRSRSSPYKEWVSVVGLSGQAMPWSWGWGHLPESGKRLVVTHCHSYRTVLQVVWFCSPELSLNQAVSPWSPQGRKGLKEP